MVLAIRERENTILAFVDLDLTPEQLQLVESLSGLLDKHSSPEAVRAAEPLGHDADLWGRLIDIGVVAMGVSEPTGGLGGSMIDLVLVAEAVGAAVAPAPVIEAQVASRLLDRVGSPAARSLLERVLDGGEVVTLALHPPVGGVARMVPAAAIADIAIVARGDELVVVDLHPSPRQVENLGAMPLADVEVPNDSIVLAGGTAARNAFDRAIDEWLLLTAGALAGIGRRSISVAAEYVTERQAFGVPIGSFQAIAHRLADSSTAVDAGLLATRQAAWAGDIADPRFGELAAGAFSLAYEAARDATYRSLHFHGGYGFMMEYDIQLLYRRARAWATIYGGPSVVRRRIADKRYGPVGEPVSGDAVS
jgi:alkylation response protein AidB-like acyl-CoA dehydrogenase